MPTVKNLTGVPIARIFLSLDNPRHNRVESEADAIAKLCAKEDIYPLARDIVTHGLNPLERFALLQIGTTKGEKARYWVAEGNRRICALKLLKDPDLAPAKLRDSFERLAKNWTPIRAVAAALFPDAESLRIWLERIHNGVQGGAGRRPWSAEQIQRFNGGNKNKAAQALLDYAQKKGFIDEDEREGKLTTAQRFMSNQVFRESLGFDQDTDDFGRTRPEAEFDRVVKRFVRDLVVGSDVSSRMNSKEIIEYSRGLNSVPGVTPTRIPTESIDAGSSKKGSSRVRRKPKKPTIAKHVQWEEEISRELKGYGNEKLQSLYFSITKLELEDHAPLIAIGCWAFFETLTACAGRIDTTPFESFLSKGKFGQWKCAGKHVDLHAAVARIHDYGNATKHNKVAAHFNGQQINNDMILLKEVILKCIAEAAIQTP